MKSYQCIGCKHYLGAFGEGSHCKAYPPEEDQFIPTEIYRGIHDHTNPFKGDNRVRFESNGEYDGWRQEDSDESLPDDITDF